MSKRVRGNNEKGISLWYDQSYRGIENYIYNLTKEFRGVFQFDFLIHFESMAFEKRDEGKTDLKYFIFRGKDRVSSRI